MKQILTIVKCDICKEDMNESTGFALKQQHGATPGSFYHYYVLDQEGFSKQNTHICKMCLESLYYVYINNVDTTLRDSLELIQQLGNRVSSQNLELTCLRQQNKGE